MVATIEKTTLFCFKQKNVFTLFSHQFDANLFQSWRIPYTPPHYSIKPAGEKFAMHMHVSIRWLKQKKHPIYLNVAREKIDKICSNRGSTPNKIFPVQNTRKFSTVDNFPTQKSSEMRSYSYGSADTRMCIANFFCYQTTLFHSQRKHQACSL